MKLELRHLSGSRAGEVESFDDSTEITVGRHPSSRVLFDPERDRSVSGHHASIHFERGQWILRDLGSSNGTFAGDTRVTEHTLHEGEILQFGSQGPRVRVSFSGAPADAIAPAPPAEGHTVMMMLPQDGAGSAAAPSVTMPRKKKGGMGRALLAVSAVGVVLLIALVALALVIRSNNIRKKRQARTVQSATTGTTSSATPAAPPSETIVSSTPAESGPAASTTADAAALQQQIAATRQTLESAQQSIEKGDPNANEIADLKRQIAESQALMEQMTRQLQEKNDEIAAQRARAAAQPKVVYVPVPTPAPAQPAPQPSSPPAYSSQEVPARPEPGSVDTPQPAPVVTRSAPSRTPRTQPPARPAASVPPPAAPAIPEIALGPLSRTKALKLKVSITSTPPEIPPANLPSGTDRGLVNLIGAALVSSGDYVVGPNGQASVSVMVTNYKADANRNVNTQGVGTSARKLGKIFGQKVPTNPVDVKNVMYDAAMSARIRLLDRAGRILLETEPSSASADRKAKVGIAGVSFNDAVLSDTAVGDVTRKVVADAVEALRATLESQEWSTVVGGATKDKVVLGVGSSARVEPGDVFEIVDGQQRVLTRVRVTSVTESASEAMLLSSPGKERLAGQTARYLGNESSSTIRRTPRTITTRAKTPVYSGPGTSFPQLRELKPGVRMNLLFTVGPWAKADDGSGAVWVPLANATIGS